MADELVDMSFEEGGLAFEADHVARCLKEGVKESADMPWDETELTMTVSQSSWSTYIPSPIVPASFGFVRLSFEAVTFHGYIRVDVDHGLILLLFFRGVSGQIFDKIRRDGGYNYLPGLERIQLE